MQRARFKPIVLAIAIAAAAAMAMVALTPSPAHASFVDDIVGTFSNLGSEASKAMSAWADNFVDTFIRQAAVGLLEQAGEHLGSITIGQLTNDFESLFIDSGAYGIVTGVHEVVINTIAYSALAIVYLVQTVRIAGRLDGAATMPGLREVIFLLIFFVAAKFVIDHSVEFCAAVYEGFTALIDQIPGFDGGSLDFEEQLSESLAAIGEDDSLNAFAVLLTALVTWLASFLAQLLGYAVVLARSLQIYVYTIVSPIPLCLLGADETRSYGLGFIKNYTALCFTGVIIALVSIMFPMILRSALATGTANPATVVALIGLYLFALAKSGSWARDVFGG